MLPVVLYSCKTCSLSLRKEHRPRVSERGSGEFVLTEEERSNSQRGEELRNLYSSASINRIFELRRKRWTEYIVLMER